MHVAIVGAGPAGLGAARHCAELGRVTVLEMGRGAGRHLGRGRGRARLQGHTLYVMFDNVRDREYNQYACLRLAE